MVDPVVFSLCAILFFLIGISVATLRPQQVVGHPWLVLAILALTSAAAVWTLVDFQERAFTITVDPASEPLIQRNDPGIPAYEQAKKDFGNDDLYVIAMETDDVFQQENLERLARLTDQLRRLPGIAEVESLTRVLFDPLRPRARKDRCLEADEACFPVIQTNWRAFEAVFLKIRFIAKY